MKKTLFSLSLLCALFISNNSFAQVNHVVISQVFGGGGNSGATYKNDFVELFNPTASPVILTGWSVQYTSAAGSFTNTALITPLTGTIQPGAYYLVQEAAGTSTVAINLPTPDATGTINMSGTAGKVALANTTTALTGTCVTTNSLTVDFVGFGATATCYEGTGPTPAPSNTTSISRASNGCTDTDQNATDFAAGTVSPRNSASPTNCCLTAPTITASALTTTVNTSYSYSITATLASTYSLSAGSLPDGLNLNTTTGVISGTTSAAALGSSTADITVTNCAGNAVATFSFITTNNAVSFTGGASQTFTICQNAATSINYLLQISDADVGQVETWSVTAPPSNGSVFLGGTQISTGSNLNPTGFTYLPNVNFNGTDIFSVQVDDGSGSPAVTTITVTINPSPTVSATSATICAGATTTLTASGTATSYTWSTGDNTASITPTPTTTTDYTVTGTDANNCTNMATTTITVNMLPTLSVNSPAICIGETTTLTATGTATSYTWSTGDNTASISPTVTTTTDYTVTGADANNCTNMAVATITVNTSLVISVAATNVTCSGSCDGSATVTTTGGVGPFTYSWIPGGTTTISSISNLCSIGNSYNVLVTDANNSCQGFQTFFITSPAPIIAFINPATTNTLCAGDSLTVKAMVIGGTSPYAYLWNSASGLNNSSTDSIVAKPTTTSTYTLNVTDAHGCTYSDTVKFNVNNCSVGIKQVLNNNNISIYPNPATDGFYLQTNTAFDNAIIEVYDMMGRKVLTEKLQGTETRINLNTLNNAIYQVRVLNNNTLIYQSKLVKQQ